MKKMSITDELVAAVDDLLNCTELNMDSMERETIDAISNAWHVRNKAHARKEGPKPK